jgi:PPOX class probable F420-dependent enzyme
VSVVPDGPFGERVAQRLRDETVAWLVTVGSDGTPQPNPVWFLWDGADRLLVYNRDNAARLVHLDARPQVSVHLDSDGRGGNIVVLAGVAGRKPDVLPPDRNPGYVAKYQEAMIRVSGSAEKFAADYPVPVEIEIRRIRGH